MRFLDEARTGELWAKVKAALSAKQDVLTGQAGQVVGFGADGAAVAVSGWSNPNLLENWYFADPINQRGQTSYENTTYTIDRWIATGEGQTVSLTDEGLKITFKANANEYCNISERFENYQQYAGKTFTASALIRNPDGNRVKLTVKPTPTGSGAAPWYSPDPPASDDWILITGTGFFSETPTGLSFLLYTFNPKQETTVFVKAVKLELGTKQTLAHQDANGNWVLNDPPPNKAMELLKCQRYFYRLKNSRYRMVACIRGNNGARFQIELPITMAKTPALSFHANNDDIQWIRTVDNAGIYKLSEIDQKYVGEFSSNSIVISLILPAVMTDAQLLVDGYIDFDSNL